MYHAVSSVILMSKIEFLKLHHLLVISSIPFIFRTSSLIYDSPAYMVNNLPVLQFTLIPASLHPQQICGHQKRPGEESRYVNAGKGIAEIGLRPLRRRVRRRRRARVPAVESRHGEQVIAIGTATVSASHGWTRVANMAASYFRAAMRGPWVN
jgi:hypothetical protein